MSKVLWNAFYAVGVIAGAVLIWKAVVPFLGMVFQQFLNLLPL